MRNLFEVKGLFYKQKGYQFREYLDIKKLGTTETTPDLMVVMMNPGSSKPVDGIHNNNIESTAKPDKTQDQIMRVMCKSGVNYSRILNLSDLREPKSKNFYSKLGELKANNIAHSIFDEDRNLDFVRLFEKSVPVIFAWGVNRRLEELARKAIDRIKEPNPIGLKKEGIEGLYYYHPLPRTNTKQVEWVEKISKMLN